MATVQYRALLRFGEFLAIKEIDYEDVGRPIRVPVGKPGDAKPFVVLCFEPRRCLESHLIEYEFVGM